MGTVVDTNTGKPRDSVPYLEIEDPSSGHRTVRLDKDLTRLGRSGDNDVQILVSHVSKHHAEIRRSGDRFVLVDAGSKAGVFVNGNSCEKRNLKDADVITLGPTPMPKIVFRTSVAVPQLSSLSSGTSLIMSLTESSGPQGLEKLSKFLEFSRLFGGQLGLDGILQDVVDLAVEITAADRGFLILGNADGSLEFRVARQKGKAPIPGGQQRVSETIVRQVLGTAKMRIVTNMGAEVDLAAMQSVMSLNLGSAAALPLRRFSLPKEGSLAEATDEVFGVLYLDSRDRRDAFSRIDIGILETLARDASSVIENARLLRDAEQMKRMEQELAMAREVQAALLPQSFWSDPHFEIAGCCLPCLQLGGDYMGQFRMPDGRCGFVIADVSGKGLPAALLAAALQGALSAESSTEQTLDRLVERMNQTICRLSPDHNFITFFCGAIDDDGVLSYVDAGHGLLRFIKANGELGVLGEKRGIALGIMDDAKYLERKLPMEPGDVLALYTDGVTEAGNQEGELLGEQPVGETIEACRSEGAAEIVEAIRGRVEAFCGEQPLGDDLTLLVLKYVGSQP